MKILIHALGASMGGALRHLTNFLPEIGKVDNINEYVVLIRESIPNIKTTENIRLLRIPDKEAAYLPSRIMGDLIKIPINLKKENYNLIVSLTNFGPIWAPIPHILYQRNPTYFCKYHLENIKGIEKNKLLMRRFWVVESMKRADVIVTPSNAMADMIKETCPSVRRKNFKTIYHGYNDQSLMSIPDEKLKNLLIYDGYKLLYPTHAAPHKGFEILFKMLFHLKKTIKNYILFIPMNSSDWPEGFIKSKQMISELHLNENVKFLGEVPQTQMGYLYQNCDLMVYPSLCESFGFSMIEALAAKLPIVTSGTSLNREICGKGALYYNPLDAIEGGRLIQEALTPGTKIKLINQGQIRFNSYNWSWNRCVKEFLQTLQIYSN